MYTWALHRLSNETVHNSDAQIIFLIPYRAIADVLSAAHMKEASGHHHRRKRRTESTRPVNLVDVAVLAASPSSADSDPGRPARKLYTSGARSPRPLPSKQSPRSPSASLEVAALRNELAELRALVQPAVAAAAAPPSYVSPEAKEAEEAEEAAQEALAEKPENIYALAIEAAIVRPPEGWRQGLRLLRVQLLAACCTFYQLVMTLGFQDAAWLDVIRNNFYGARSRRTALMPRHHRPRPRVPPPPSPILPPCAPRHLATPPSERSLPGAAAVEQLLPRQDSRDVRHKRRRRGLRHPPRRPPCAAAIDGFRSLLPTQHRTRNTATALYLTLYLCSHVVRHARPRRTTHRR